MSPIPTVIGGLLNLLDRLGIDYAIGGSFASSAWGEPRQTRDLDLNLILSQELAERLANAVTGVYDCSVAEIEAAVTGTQEFRSFQLLHMDEVFKIDAFVLDSNEYTRELWMRRVRLPLGPEQDAWFMSAEDIVLTKLRWFVLGGRVSDRQWNDVVQVLETQWQTFAFDYAERWSDQFGVRAEFDQAREQAAPA